MKRTFTIATALGLSMIIVMSAPLGAAAHSTSDEIIDSDQFYRTAIVSARPAADYSGKIEALLKRMSVEEKVGQMTQLTLEALVTGHNQTVEIDRAKLDKAIKRYQVGSILNCYNQALTPEKWQRIISQIQSAAKSTRLGIPVIYGIDSIHGANYVQGATLFPQQIGMAATWNPELMKRAAAISASETRAAGIPWSFSPVLDLGRQPFWPRFWETFGEDPYLARVLGVGFRPWHAKARIFARRSMSQSQFEALHGLQLSTERTRSHLRPGFRKTICANIFYRPLSAAIQAGARTVMVNSGEINGVPVHV